MKYFKISPTKILTLASIFTILKIWVPLKNSLMLNELSVDENIDLIVRVAILYFLNFLLIFLIMSTLLGSICFINNLINKKIKLILK